MAQHENAGVHTADVVVVGSGSAGRGDRAPARRCGRQRRCCSKRDCPTTTPRSTTLHGFSSCGTATRTGATAPCRRPGAPVVHCTGRAAASLGGSSALNGMIYVRGARADYAGWAAAGNRGWDYRRGTPAVQALGGLRPRRRRSSTGRAARWR